jgi:hypothetical protein
VRVPRAMGTTIVMTLDVLRTAAAIAGMLNR